MEYDGELSLDAKEVVEQNPKLGRKNRSAVTDNGVRKPIMLYYYVTNYFCKSWSINGDLDWLVMYHFSQIIDNEEN